MAHRKLTSEQVAELIMADEAEGEEGELPDSDCSVALSTNYPRRRLRRN